MTAKRNPAPVRTVKTKTQPKKGRTTARPKPRRNGTPQSHVVIPPGKGGGGSGAAPKKRTAPNGYSATLSPHGYWVAGENDTAPTCVATAIANSLLAQTGIRVSDADVMHLHDLASNSDGVSIAECLAVLGWYGIGGWQPVSYEPAEDFRVGSIVGLSDGKNDHAVTYTPAGLISWGAPLEGDLAKGWFTDGEAWSIDWRGEGN